MRYAQFFLLLALISLSAPGSLHAADDALPNIKNHPLAGILDARLIPQVDAIRANASTDAKSAQTVKALHPRAVLQTPKPEQLAVRLNTPVTADSLKRIGATGATIVSSAPQWNTVCVMATVSQIDALTKIAGIATIKLQSRPKTRKQGVAPNQADAIMHADALRSSAGLTGAGQTIGIISDSVTDTSAVGKGTVSGAVPNAMVSSTKPQGTGDLPSTFQVVDFGPGGGTDEGEGMMEVAHDVAPGAVLAFGSCGNDQTEFARTLGLLRTAAHCSITVDDIGFTDEPFFQEGPAAQAMAANRASGIIHFSAFGNDANQAVTTTYKSINASVSADNSVYPPDGSSFHDWGNGIGAFLPVTIPAGDSVSIILQWDQPFSSFNLGAGSNSDMDMYLCPGASFDINTTVASSENGQGKVGAPSGDPMEEIDYTNFSHSNKTLYLVINHFRGSRTASTGSGGNNMRIVFDDDGFGAMPTINPVGGNSISAYGHPTSQYCVAVGAVDYALPNIPENYTSKGGNIPYYFNTSGGASFSVRVAPDIAAPDGSDTSVFGDDTDGDGFPNFYGTSCAAPNAASAAALLLQAAPSTTPAALLALLKSSATDIVKAPTEDPGISMSGNDVYTGAGLINVDQAAGVPSGPAITSPLSASSNAGSTFSYTITATGQAPITFGATSLPSGLTFSGATISGIPGAQGTYTIALSASNGVGLASANLQLVVGAPVPVTITSGPSAVPNPANVGSNVIFNVAATGSGRGITTTWTYGDGQSGSGAPASHAYSAAGNYSVTVSLVDQNGQSATGSLQVTVLLPPLVFAQVSSATPSQTYTTIQILFLSNVSGGVAPLSFAWNFGDGVTSTLVNPVHTFSTAGTFTVALTVSDSANQSISANVTVSVADFTPIAIVSQATADPNPAGVGQRVGFAVSAQGNGNVAYSWTFGDGSSASGPQTSHVYASAGVYTVSLSIVDATQQSASAQFAVTVNAPVVGMGNDSDGDGYSDTFESFAGSNPNDPNSVPFGAPMTNAPRPLAVTRLSTLLNFARTLHDTIQLTGVLPVPAGFDPTTATVAFDIGGVDFSSALNAKGQGGKAFKLTLKKVKGLIPAQSARFLLKLANGNFAATLASSGLTDETVKAASVRIKVTALFSGGIYQANQSQLYTARIKKSGTSR